MPFVIVLCCVPLISCKKESVTPMDITFILHDWAVLSMTSPGATQPQIAPLRIDPKTGAKVPYSFSFFLYQGSKNVGIRLDVNDCGGSMFDVPGKGKITIGYFGCTKVCCDSKFAVALVQLAPTLTEYTINGDTLTLNGLGQIKMKH